MTLQDECEVIYIGDRITEQNGRIYTDDKTKDRNVTQHLVTVL